MNKIFEKALANYNDIKTAMDIPMTILFILSGVGIISLMYFFPIPFFVILLVGGVIVYIQASNIGK